MVFPSLPLNITAFHVSCNTSSFLRRKVREAQAAAPVERICQPRPLGGLYFFQKSGELPMGKTWENAQPSTHTTHLMAVGNDGNDSLPVRKMHCEVGVLHV